MTAETILLCVIGRTYDDFILRREALLQPSLLILMAGNVATVALACAHTGQCIVFHNALPGDIADARLVNCILEHVFQRLRGHGEFLSTEQFYPLKDTIVYSDNHFGTGPIYAIFRLAGLSMEAAFTGWILAVISLDTIAVLFLLRRLRYYPLIASPLALFAASSSALVYQTGHPQLLPFFPFVFCLSFLLKFLTSGRQTTCLGSALVCLSELVLPV